jgi:hypothetical protein
LKNEDLVVLKDLPKLEELSLWSNSIGDSGLANVSHLSQLQSLTLNETLVTDQGLAHLTNLSALRHVALLETDVTQAGVDAALPGKHVQLSRQTPILVVRVRMPSGELVNSYAGSFTLSLIKTEPSGGALSTTTSGSSLQPMHLRWSHLNFSDGTIAVKLTLDQKLTATATAIVAAGQSSPRVVILDMQPVE